MAILATVAAGFGSLILAVLVCVKLHEQLDGRWSDKRIDATSAIFCVLLTGTSAYVMAAFGLITITNAALIHFGVGIFYSIMIAIRLMNYIEAFVLATIVCVLCALMIPSAAAIGGRHRETSIHRSPYCCIHAEPFGTLRLFGNKPWPWYNLL